MNTGRRGTARVLVSLICLGSLASEVARIDRVEAEEPPPVGAPDVDLKEVIVTGSRIPIANDKAPLPLRVYTRDQIDNSGASTVADFLDALPEVSLSVNENGFQTLSGTTTVQIHGLPIGTTLVLLNGRRVGSSGAAQAYGLTYFDLNTIPLAAIDHIELVSEGSSAIYGSDAIAGVVNVILKKNLNGFEANAKYGSASGTNEWGGDAAWGRSDDKGSLTVLGSYLRRSELPGYDRALTNDNNYTRYGGADADFYMCPDQANIYSLNGGNLPGIGAPYAGVPSGYTGTPSRNEFLATAGSLNRCSYERYDSRIQGTERASMLIEGAYEFTPAVEFYGNVLYSNVKQYGYNTPPFLYGAPGYQQYSVGANNPFNPFGEVVGVSEMLSTLGRSVQDLGTNYFNAVIGFRGRISPSWTWDVGISDSEDRSHYTQPDMNSELVQQDLDSSSPAMALNPFIAAPPGSGKLLQSLITQDYLDFLSRATVVDAVTRGSLVTLPGGPLSVAVGGEYERDTLSQNQFIFPGPVQPTNFHRKNYALFAEARVPIIGSRADSRSGEILAFTVAGRFDHDDQFGGKSTPQFGAEFRPLETLLFRASYSRAFRAPDLVDLYRARTTFSGQVSDPLRGNTTEQVSITTGGNPLLRASTGLSRTFGVDYNGLSPDLHISITHWNIKDSSSIQELPAQVIVDNAALFPGAVARASSCQGAPPCPITTVSATFWNFGNLDIAGLDYRVIYKKHTDIGTFIPSLAVTQTYRYEASLSPAAPTVNAVSAAQATGDWAPRWKGTAALEWRRGNWSAYLDGRYVGSYRDYDSTRMIGDFWLVDANVRFAIGRVLAPSSPFWQDLNVRVGAVNLFNRLPQFSNYLFGSIGYDPAQGDIRGRFLYGQLGVRW